MKTLSAVFATAFLLSACGLTPEGEIVRTAIKEKGATVADAKLQNDLWSMCEANSIGAIRRRFGRDAQQAMAYTALCLHSNPGAATLILRAPQPKGLGNGD